MDTLNIGLLTALISGVISFASPCVLPIVPGYLSFITGLGLQDLTNQDRRKTVLRKAAMNSIVFVVGFSIVFIILGASATAAGSFLRDNLGILGKVAGAVIVIFGLHMVGLIKIPFLLYEKRLHSESKSLGAGRSLTAGILFAFGWTPCIGPILAGILAIAAVQETATRGMVLLGVYSLGLGIPFVLSAVFLNAFFTAFAKVKHHLHKVEVAGGIVLIAIGLLIFTGNLAAISQKFDFMNPEYFLQRESGASPKQEGSPVSPQNKNDNLSAQDTSSERQANNITANYGKYDFTLKTLDGHTIRLSDYSGKVVLVNIWVPWCGPCRMETPGFVKLYEQYQNHGFEIVSVAVETNEKDVEAFIKKYSVRWPVGMDDEIAHAYGTYGLPDNFLFGPDGKVIKHFVGFTNEETLKPLIENTLKRLSLHSMNNDKLIHN